MRKKNYVTFPLKLTPEEHETLRMAAFARNKSMQRYCVDIVMQAAACDSKSIQMSPLHDEEERTNA